MGWIVSAGDQFGIREAAFTMAAALYKMGCKVTIVVLGHGEAAAWFEARRLETISVPAADIPFVHRASLMHTARQFLTLRNMEKQCLPLVRTALQAKVFDLIHFSSQNLIGIAGRLAKERGIPCIWHLANAIGGGYPLSINKLIYQLQCRALGIIPLGNSRFTAQSLGSALVEPRVLYIGVDSSRFNPERVSPVGRSQLGIPEKAIVFGLFARIIPKKGQEIFLKALLSVSDYTSPLHLLLLGGPIEGEFPAQLRRLAASHGSSDRLHMPGVVADTERYYDIIDIGVNARIDPEPFGLSVIESMMMRRPVLVHALGGPAETVIDGVTGWHVPNPSVESFRNGIVRALTDRARWREMGEAGRKHALANYTDDVMAGNYLQLVKHSGLITTQS